MTLPMPRPAIDWAAGPPFVALVLAAAALAGCAATTPPAAPEVHTEVVFPPPPAPARFYYERTLSTTSTVKPPEGNERLKQLLTGATPPSPRGFAKPFDVAVHRGRVFVTDTVLRAVVALDVAEGRSFTIGQNGDQGDLQKPLGIAVDRSGTLYVCDATHRRVLVYDRDGHYLRSIGGPHWFDRPAGLDVDPAGTRLFVVDTGGVQSPHHGLQVFDARTGAHLRDLRRRGTAAGQFNLPRDVAVGPDGLLYVSDGGNFRVQALTQEGAPVRAWGSPGRRYGQFTRPKGIGADPAGNLYVVDAAFGNFQIFDPDGALLLFVGDRLERGGPGKYMLPSGIDVDEDGRVYVVDQYFRKVEVFRPAALTPAGGAQGSGAAAQRRPPPG